MSCALILLAQSCSKYDDSGLWDAVNDIDGRVSELEKAASRMNTDIGSLNSIVRAMQNNVTITSVTETENGIEIRFSDGKVSRISDGKPGLNAPAISMRLDEDGVYYWTADGEWLLIDGERVPASATAPQLRINESTKEWEISADGGKTWTSTGVVAEGKSGEGVFKDVDTSDSDYVIFTLQDGTVLKIARQDSSAPVFEIEGAGEFHKIPAGTSKSFGVREERVKDYAIQKPDGWRVSYTNGTLTVSAPEKGNTYAEPAGRISVYATSASGKSVVASIEAGIYELRVLTFEDSDAAFAPYLLDYCGKNVSRWSDLVDSPQYGGPMLYNDYSSAPYYWYDENNTGLFSELNFGGPFWMGGEVISNYYDPDFEGKNYTEQLTVSVKGGAAGAGGHNRSANFAVHNGHEDYFSQGRTGNLHFADGVARIIDHMYVTNISYGLNSLVYGDGFNQPAGETTWIKILATGYDGNDEETGAAEFYLYKDGKAVNEWSKFDLSSLGEVVKVVFNIFGSEDMTGAYGLNFPAYFAYDDIAVRY